MSLTLKNIDIRVNEINKILENDSDLDINIILSLKEEIEEIKDKLSEIKEIEE